MGILTDYFVADHNQLAGLFTGWLTVAANPEIREAKNPFTGTMQRTKAWPPGSPIAAGPTADRIDLGPLPNVQFKRVDHAKIADLSNLLTNTSVDDAMDQLSKPALVHPTNDETGLHEIPAPLVAALGQLSDDALERLASQWQQ